jgi:hypothetical protein
MGSLYLNGLTADGRTALEKQLWDQQNGKCFICGNPIELGLDELDVDHIIPTRDSGKDDRTNFALTQSSCNRSKQAADLRVARVLARFERIKETADSDDRGANLNDVLKSYGGAKGSLRAKIEGETITYIVDGDHKISVPVHTDKLSGIRYFFAVLPLPPLYHDERINPRPIGSNVRGLVEEFFKGRPQLHVALGWISAAELPEARVNIFDGQHKAAAQILLGAQTLPVRIFIDPNFDILLTTNTNAGTTLRQVAFDKSVQRRLGSAMLLDRVVRFRKDKGFPDDDESFSEKSLVEHFRGDQRAVARYVLDGIRNAITYSPENKLRDYIDNAGKGHEKPFSYSAIEKTFYSKFIGSAMLETPWNYRSDMGENPRTTEVEQVVRLMSLISEKVYVGKYDEEIGTSKIENKVQKGEDVPERHLRAFRMAKEEILYCWIGYIGKIIESHFLMLGRVVDNERLFQYVFPEQLWINIGYFIDNLSRLPMWVNRDASLTIFGGKQTHGFWQTIFESGSSPMGHKALPSGLNVMEMIKP